MIGKSIKILVLSTAGAAVVGGVLLGTEFGSYVTSSVRSVRDSAKDNVPVEFQLQRARHLLDDIIPEMQANIRLIAQQEVEIGALRREIEDGRKALAEEQERVQRLRKHLSGDQEKYSIGGLTYTRGELKEELARRFAHVKEAEVILAGKGRLLANQEKALRAATESIDRTRAQKVTLEGQIASLEAQHRLVQAASKGSKTGLDQSKLAQTEKVIAQVKKQLDVAERVLAHEAKFTELWPVDGVAVDEKALVSEVDEHFAGRKEEPQVEARLLTPGR
jgi:hypothetical protein